MSDDAQGSSQLSLPPIDVLIAGARVIDGTGNPSFPGDIAIKDDRIVGLASHSGIPWDRAREIVYAPAMVACPGFIDIQSHSICTLLADGRSLSKITQGVTTEIMGETWTPAPFGGLAQHPFPPGSPEYLPSHWPERARRWHRFRDWLEATAERGVSPNLGSFLSGGTLRRYAMGMRMGPPNDDELAAMRRVARMAVKDGAFGIAYALAYPPDAYASSEEIVEVCRQVGQEAGLFITHLRSEGKRLLEAIDEAVEIGHRACLPIEIYHLKTAGRLHWHKQPEALARIEAAQASGVDITADMYPYTSSATGLSAMLPMWVEADGQLWENLGGAGTRARIRDELSLAAENGDILGPEDITPVGLQRPEHATYSGRPLSQIAALRGQMWIDCMLDLLLGERQPIQTIRLTMCEENVEQLVRQPWVKFASDEAGYDPAWAAAFGPVHPRAYGAFTRVLGRCVRERHLLTLEEAIRKMTSAVADRLGLRDRGRLLPGCFADVVIFDPESVGDRASIEDPHRLSTGVREVWINGVRVLANGAHTGATPGRVVSGPGCAGSG